MNLFIIYCWTWSSSDASGSSISSLITITVVFRWHQKLNFNLLMVTIVFRHLQELNFKCTYWRSRLSFGALVVQFWVYCHIANRNRFRSENSETSFKLNVKLWLSGDFRDPSLKYQELPWQVDTLIVVVRYIMNNVQSLCKAIKGKQNLLNI